MTFWDESHFHSHYLSQRLREVKDHFKQVEAETNADLRCAFDLLSQLETDIGRTLLKLHAVIQVLIEKRLISEDEIAGQANKLDDLDGHHDGALHPSLFRTQEELARVKTPRAFLKALEADDHVVSPRDFLSQLQEDAKSEGD